MKINIDETIEVHFTNESSNLNEIPIKITVVLGQATVPLKNISELDEGSLIKIEKLAGEPVSILVNGKLKFKGEVVVIDENFGVRITDIVQEKDEQLFMGVKDYIPFVDIIKKTKSTQ
jgi:flagellar motor switch protein FliN